jgi:hypothetical protein
LQEKKRGGARKEKGRCKKRKGEVQEKKRGGAIKEK